MDLALSGQTKSVHGLGEWYAKFKANKFPPGIAFTIFALNQ